MREDTDLIKITKLEKIKIFIAKLLKNKIFCISLFFFFIYTSTELLNNITYKEIIQSGVTMKERIHSMLLAIYTFFLFHKVVGTAFIFLGAYLIFKVMTGKTKLTCFIIGFIAEVYGIINYIILDARGVGLSISDIYSVKTAMNVAKGMKVEINIFFIISILIYTLANIFLFKNNVFSKKEEKNNWKIKVKKFAVACVIFVIMFNFAPLMNRIDAWDVNFAYKFSGAGLAIMRMFKDINLKKPAGYSIEKVEEILNCYTDDEIESIEEKPNIIVVMNESFSDLESVFNINLEEDPLTYYKSLISGENIVSRSYTFFRVWWRNCKRGV